MSFVLGFILGFAICYYGFNLDKQRETSQEQHYQDAVEYIKTESPTFAYLLEHIKVVEFSKTPCGHHTLGCAFMYDSRIVLNMVGDPRKDSIVVIHEAAHLAGEDECGAINMHSEYLRSINPSELELSYYVQGMLLSHGCL